MFARCHICQKNQVEEIREYRLIRRVTSDCKIWRTDGGMGFCHHCGGVQKSIDSAWNKETEQIYHQYEIYYQSQGEEQIVLSSTGGRFSRSHELFRHFLDEFPLPPEGNLLDMGCGNGTLLQTFNGFCPGWKLSGVEIDERHKAVLEKINGFDHLYTTAMPDKENDYDLITMVHFLEHVAFPGNMLRQVRALIKPKGYLLIQVPLYKVNPFDLLIADHSTHFSLFSLEYLLAAAGFDILSFNQNWIQKELSVVAQKRVKNTEQPPFSTPETIDDIKKALKWLNGVSTEAHSISRNRPFGVFGTSIAAVWLFHELNGQIDFFADEDKNRTGRTLFGKMIYHPEKIPRDAHLFIGLAPSLAETIFHKYKEAHFYCYKPRGISDPPLNGKNPSLDETRTSSER